jgi:type IV pilus assembly protein PilM
VRLVELADAGKGELRLERYASEPLARGTVVDGNIENIEAVSEAVLRVWKKSGTKIKHVALGMPPAAVITKKIILPAGLAEDQLEVQVESEASQYIPFALDEVSLDFDVIGQAPNSPEDMEVMLAAARREKVEDRVAIAEAAGLTATVMDIESYAARAAASAPSTRPRTTRAARKAGSWPCSRSAPRPPTFRCCRTARPSTNANSPSAASS